MSSTRGITLMVSAVSLFSLMAALVKLADRVPPGEAVFFRAFCALPVIIIWLALRGELRTGLRVERWQGHAVRGIAGSMAMGLGFFGLKLIPLPEATAIRFVTPILVVVFAAFFLSEAIRAFRITAVLVGLFGVCIVMWPRLTFDLGDAAVLGAMVTLASAGLAALAQVFLKSMAGTESTTAIVFWFSSTAAFLALCSAPFGWVMPTWDEWGILISMGLIGGMGQVLLTSSYKYAEASTLAPFTYVSMIWSVIIGYLVFAEVPTAGMLAGAILVIAAGVAIVLRERALGLERTAKRKGDALMKNG